MPSVKRLFLELKFEIIKISVIRAFLNAAIFFLVLNIVFLLLGVSVLYALLLAAVYFGINAYLKYASITLKSIEDANPEVKEMLRTAKDTMGDDNIMIRALQQEVLQKAKSIASGNLLDYGKLTVRLVVLAVLVLGSVFTATLNLHLNDVEIPYDKLNFRGRLSSYGLDSPVDLEGGSLEEDDSIYGESRVAKLGNEILNLNFNPSISEMDLDKLKDEEGLAMGRMSYPVEVEAEGAEASLAKKPQESELVNAFYMKKIAR